MYKRNTNNVSEFVTATHNLSRKRMQAFFKSMVKKCTSAYIFGIIRFVRMCRIAFANKTFTFSATVLPLLLYNVFLSTESLTLSENLFIQFRRRIDPHKIH